MQSRGRGTAIVIGASHLPHRAPTFTLRRCLRSCTECRQGGRGDLRFGSVYDGRAKVANRPTTDVRGSHPQRSFDGAIRPKTFLTPLWSRISVLSEEIGRSLFRAALVVSLSLTFLVAVDQVGALVKHLIADIESLRRALVLEC